MPELVSKCSRRSTLVFVAIIVSAPLKGKIPCSTYASRSRAGSVAQWIRRSNKPRIHAHDANYVSLFVLCACDLVVYSHSSPFHSSFAVDRIRIGRLASMGTKALESYSSE